MCTGRSPPCRSAYQRAVVVPTEKLEALWAAYENFELGGAAKALGRRALDDMRPRYQVQAASLEYGCIYMQVWMEMERTASLLTASHHSQAFSPEDTHRSA